MDIQFYGANCARLSTKNAVVVADDNLKELGLKTVTRPQDILLRTSPLMPVHPAAFSADMPGEYELADVSIQGIAARAHTDEQGKKSAVMYKITADDINVAVIGHVHPDLADEQLEQLGTVDIMLVPVGGNGYTLDGVGALKLIKAIEPKVVIPTHYAQKGIKYQVPQQELGEALKAMSMEPLETLDKFKPKSLEISDSTKLIVLNCQ